MLPAGISSGFLSLTLPFMLTRAGIAAATMAAVVAIGNSASRWRFLWLNTAAADERRMVYTPALYVAAARG